jgi:hypothetical protein
MPRVEKLDWRDEPLEAIRFPTAELRLTLGLGSGLCSRDGRIFAVTDRGPNLFVSQAVDDYGLVHLERLRSIRDAKIMPMPDAGPEIAELRVEGAAVRLVKHFPLVTRSGRRLSGRTLPGAEMEQVFNVDGQPVRPDPLGADTEAVAAMPDGGFFLAEEYGPSLLKSDANGVVGERWVAAGREMELVHPDIRVRGVLPPAAARRRVNRGFEALAASADGAFLYLALQSAQSGEDQNFVPVWKFDTGTGALVHEWRYPFDAPSSFRRDAGRRKVGAGDLKICEFTWVGDDRLIVLERIAHSTKLYDVDLRRLPEKTLLISSDDHPEIDPDIEGMTLLSATEILICSDNDFGVEGAETGFWRISLDQPLAPEGSQA